MKPVQLLPFLIVGLLAFVGKTQARSPRSYHIEIPQGLPANEPTYAWFVGDEEEQRINELLEHDVGELGFLGFYMNVPPLKCPHCGKNTEIIDWVYTALQRGIHSKEWIVKALREGKISQKNAHDVYCSRCGHLTLFRDPTGDEGGVNHIVDAAPYDRATKSFTFKKRDEAAAAATGGEDAGAWRPIWLVKKSETPKAAAAATDGEDAGAWRPIWLVKKSETSEEDAAAPALDEATPEIDPLHGWHPFWLVNKSESANTTNDEVAPDVGWRPSWLLKKSEVPEASATEALAEESADQTAPALYSWYTQRMVKKADAET